MGFFDDIWKGPADFQSKTFGETDAKSVLNPAGRLSEMAYDEGYDEIGRLLDPMDLFGEGAKSTRDQVKDILLRSAQEGIKEQERQYQTVEGLFKPFYEGGKRGLSDIQGMATSGEMPADYKVSKLAEMQMKRGTQNIKAGMAKQGLLNSSATSGEISNLASGVAAEEAERAYGGRLSQIQLGADAGQAVAQAGGALSGNVSSLYGNVGSNLNQTQQAYGEARQAAYQGMSNTLGQMAAYAG